MVNTENENKYCPDAKYQLHNILNDIPNLLSRSIFAEETASSIEKFLADAVTRDFENRKAKALGDKFEPNYDADRACIEIRTVSKLVGILGDEVASSKIITILGLANVGGIIAWGIKNET